MRKHTDNELITELIRIKNILGHNPKQDEMSKYSKYSINSYKRAFGGLSKALIRIGEKPNIKLDVINYDICEQIKKVYSIVNRSPTIEDVRKHSDISYFAIKRLMKNMSWHKLLLEAGVSIDDVSVSIKQNVTNEDLKNEILRLKKLLGRYPNYYEMKRNGLYSCDTYSRRFGSYLKAMKSLGFTDYQNQSIYHAQIQTKGIDKITYKSMFEAEIANYLFEIKTDGKITEYVYEKQVCKEKTWTCDFFITLNDGSKIWIEADGMGENRTIPYGPENEKIKYYIDHFFRFYVIKYRRKISNQLDLIFKTITIMI